MMSDQSSLRVQSADANWCGAGTSRGIDGASIRKESVAKFSQVGRKARSRTRFGRRRCRRHFVESSTEEMGIGSGGREIKAVCVINSCRVAGLRRLEGRSDGLMALSGERDVVGRLGMYSF